MENLRRDRLAAPDAPLAGSRPYRSTLGGLTKTWRWLTANVIDLWKGAAVASVVVPIGLVFVAIDQGLSRPLAWVLLAAAVATLPLVLFTARRYEETQQGDRTPLPPLDQQPGAEPLRHVRRVE
jgi:hypothetical protein